MEVSDDASIGQSWLGRTEGFYNASHAADTDAAVTDEANAQLGNRRAKIRFGGQILNSRDSQYGIHWGLGDRVPIFAFGRELEGVIRNVSVAIGANGVEQINAIIEGEYSLV